MVNNRKNILINKNFQISIITKFAILSFCIIGVYFLSVSYFFSEMNLQAQNAGLPTDHVFFQFIEQQKSLMHKIFILSSIAALFLIIGGGLWLSHQVAGPLYRLITHLKTHKNASEVPPLTFRKGDYFPELQDAFNDFIKKDS